MNYTTIKWEISNGVGIITLNRPEKLNTFTVQVFNDLQEALLKAETDQSVKVLLIKGAGGTFSAGGDMEMLKYLTSFQEEVLLRETVTKLIKLAGQLNHLEIPSLAAIRGYCLGVGLSLASLCDIRLASNNSIFGTEFIAMGLLPDTGILHSLPRLVGLGKAKEMLLTGRRIKGEEAEKIGLVNTLLSDDELEQEAFNMAHRIAQLPPVAIKMTREGLDKFTGKTIEDILSYESFAQSVCLKTEDHHEAVSAFLSKRKPVFKGK